MKRSQIIFCYSKKEVYTKMPFIIQERRELMKNGTLTEDWQPEDYCYFYYKEMVEEWKKNPGWSTAHNIYRKMKAQTTNLIYKMDKEIAKELAWQVFFQLYVIPYELKKKEENGDI